MSKRHHTAADLDASRVEVAEFLAVSEEMSMAPNLIRCCVLSTPVFGLSGENINEKLNTVVGETQDWLATAAETKGWPSVLMETTGDVHDVEAKQAEEKRLRSEYYADVPGPTPDACCTVS